MIVDDHAIVRRGMAELLNDESDLEVCGEAESVLEAKRAIDKTKPDLVIVDLSLRNESGIELIKDLKIQFPHLPILVLSMHDESYYAQRTIRAGAMGYIMKEEAPDAIIDAVRHVLAGKVYVSPDVAGAMLGQMVGKKTAVEHSPIDRLSDRELQVLQLIGKGMGTREIATNLHLSIKTIENHRERLKSKLALGSATELVRFAVQWSIEEHSG